MSYYTKWRHVIGTQLFQKFLQSEYAKGISHLNAFNREALFSDPTFTCLLCGVGNEATARSFIQFVTRRNPHSKMYIIDLGSEQIEAVKNLVANYFPEYDITVRQMDALDLRSYLNKSSVNWIETDGFLEFFPIHSLRKLLEIWYTLLKPNGFVTIREPASDSFLGSLIDVWRITIAKGWLGIRIYVHTLKDLSNMFDEKRFRYVSSPTIVPTFRRFTLVKS